MKTWPVDPLGLRNIQQGSYISLLGGWKNTHTFLATMKAECFFGGGDVLNLRGYREP